MGSKSRSNHAPGANMPRKLEKELKRLKRLSEKADKGLDGSKKKE